MALLVGLDLVSCGGGGASPPPTVGPAPEVVPIRRLTNDEYLASVTDLFPGFAIETPSFVSDTKVLGFTNLSSSQTSSLVRTEQYEAAAEAISTQVSADPTVLTGCDAAAQGELACAQPYLFDLAKRAYRRPLAAAETQSLGALFTLNSDAVDYPTRLGLAIQGVLLSPKFLFRVELGDSAHPRDGVGLPLTSWEVASRLSYFINGSLPDAELTAAADSGKLGSADEVARQAQRLLALPRSQEHLVGFHEQWLGVDTIGALSKNTTAFPNFTALLAYYLGQETHRFLKNVLFDPQAKFSDLFLANYTFGNQALADYYGAEAPAADGDRMDLDPTERAGILTQGSLLATMAKEDRTDPVRRGKFILQQILCRNIPAPSAAIVAMFKPLDLSKTARDQFTQHRQSDACNQCHQYLDPLGLPFEHYDGVGKWRDDDRGMTLDVTGDIVDADGITHHAFDGIPQLAQLLVDMPEARTCYTAQWFRYSSGRLDGDTDKAYLDWLTSGFTRDSKVVDLVTALVQSDSFRYLKAPDSSAGSSP